MHKDSKNNIDTQGLFLYYSLFSGLYNTSDEIWIYKRPFEDELPEPKDIMNDN